MLMKTWGPYLLGRLSNKWLACSGWKGRIGHCKFTVWLEPFSQCQHTVLPILSKWIKMCEADVKDNPWCLFLKLNSLKPARFPCILRVHTYLFAQVVCSSRYLHWGESGMATESGGEERSVSVSLRQKKREKQNQESETTSKLLPGNEKHIWFRLCIMLKVFSCRKRSQREWVSPRIATHQNLQTELESYKSQWDILSFRFASFCLFLKVCLISNKHF